MLFKYFIIFAAGKITYQHWPSTMLKIFTRTPQITHRIVLQHLPKRGGHHHRRQPVYFSLLQGARTRYEKPQIARTAKAQFTPRRVRLVRTHKPTPPVLYVEIERGESRFHARAHASR